MKAIRVSEFGPPEVMRLEAVPEPAPGSGEALVTIKAAGVNPVEAYIRSGTYAFRPPLPYTPGSDGAGVVAVVGPGVKNVKAGDRVYVYAWGAGTYAELALCAAEDIYPLPETLSFAQGAAIGVPYGTAWRALFKRGLAQAGETVVVHGGTGGVGLAAVQLAAAAGLKVIATGGSERGRRLLLEQGAAVVLGHEEANDERRILDLTGGRGADLVLEMLANVNLGKDLGVLAPGGRVVVIGSRGPVEIDPRMTMGKELDIRGMTLRRASRADLDAMHAAIGAGLSDGALRPVAGREFPLAEAAAAHAAVMGKEAYGKIVLVP